MPYSECHFLCEALITSPVGYALLFMDDSNVIWVWERWGDLETKVELTPDLGLLDIWESPLTALCLHFLA